MSRSLAITFALFMSAVASSASADMLAYDSVAPVNIRIVHYQDRMRQMTPQLFDNPAMKQWMMPVSYNTLSAKYTDSQQSQAIDCRLGDGLHYFGIEADSYIKHRSTTLWGTAAYHNGTRQSVVWNESSDFSIIYPYFTADSIGGNLKGESYAFSGGYADHNDRWDWGVTLSYNAGQYYRNVDPRPRNVTGRLDIAVAGAYRLGNSDYRIGAAINFRKYKQSCSIEFVNELSDTRIWHLTGLGNHYKRFTGSGASHYYNGHRWGGSIDLFPSQLRGAVLSASFSHFSFDHILSSLNKLPLATATDNNMRLTAGWLAPGEHHDWAVAACAVVSKRSGTENIFGDASANVYPKIGSMKMYTHTLLDVNLSGLWQWHSDASTLASVKPHVALNRSRESYAEPHRHILIAGLTPGIDISFNRGFGRWWRAGFKTSYSHTCIVDSDLDFAISASDPIGMQTLEIQRFDILSKANDKFSLCATASRAISEKYALQLSAEFSYISYTDRINARNLDIALSFIF